MYKKIFTTLFLILVCSTGFGQGTAKIKKIEKRIAAVVKKVMPATVKIAAFDTLSQTLAVSRFSGVVVSAEGLILTAAHATQPKQIYQVCFPNGRKVLAKGLGRISMGKDKPATDVAMMQIMEVGKWPYAEMGYSSEMRMGQLCVGISFPGTFEQQRPNIRLGKLEKTEIVNGNFQSSCKMEPGDSGGGLFDATGRLIGIHSWILRNENQNFEVPIDLYRTYWDALKIPISYDQLPLVKNVISEPYPNIPDVVQPLDQFADIHINKSSSVVGISSIKNKDVQCYIRGTLLKLSVDNKTVQVIISKNSEIGEQITVVSNGKHVKAKAIYRDTKNDLILLAIEDKLPDGIDLLSRHKKDSVAIGTMLFSILEDGRAKTGITGTSKIDMSLKYSIGYFGADARFIDGKVTITAIPKGCPADGILEKADQILSINGVPLERPEQYGVELARYYQDDTLSIMAKREEKILKLSVPLGIYRGYKHTSTEFPGGRSSRSDGFTEVIIQDASLSAAECGGPVFAAGGRFIGINIARHSRTSTVIMPTEIIVKSLQRFFLNQINSKADKTAIRT